jgi:hypothetical protein
MFRPGIVADEKFLKTCADGNSFWVVDFLRRKSMFDADMVEAELEFAKLVANKCLSQMEKPEQSDLTENERLKMELDEAHATIARVQAMTTSELDSVWCPWCMAVDQDDCGDDCPATRATSRVKGGE